VIITLLIEEREQLRKLGCKMKSFQQFQEEGSHGEKVKGEFMSYATMKAKGIKPKRTAVQNVINNTIRPAQGKPTGQKRSDYDARHKHMDRKESPKATVTKGREAKARADAAMRDTRGT